MNATIDAIKRHQGRIGRSASISVGYAQADVSGGGLIIDLGFTLENMPTQDTPCWILFSEERSGKEIGSGFLVCADSFKAPETGVGYDLSYYCLFSVAHDFGLTPRDVVCATISFGENGIRAQLEGNPIRIPVTFL
ncbi:hypothetical protein [Nitrospirillum sp. BR 11828]|uniref:hypothetical protein n=1 Tax=Nitrospirillum sp. BR 11828 TaxID=3104325 RepID=UPI002ACA8590|nr:hypothetical protein [Nitrospirillum sp. BR 11828]MDZ5648764.1 hypothetical protein [Nitrospirillum sp. BR 11828]